MSIVLRAEGQEVIQYLDDRLPYPPESVGPGSFLTKPSGEVMAAWMFEPGANDAYELHVASDDPRWAMRGNLKSMFWQGFVELGARRIMTGIGATNKRSYRLAKWAGFEVAGYLRNWYGEEDCLLMDLLKEDCRWLEDDDDG